MKKKIGLLTIGQSPREDVLPEIRMILGSSHPQDVKAAARMRKAAVDLIVLDCIGYSLETKGRIERTAGKPVLLPRTVLARMISEFIGII